MDYGELRYIQKEERISSSLSEVDSDFDEELKKFLHPSSDEEIRLARSMMVCAKDVLRKRFRKIIDRCVMNVETDVDSEYTMHMTKNEKELYNKLYDLFSEYLDKYLEE